MTTSRSMSIVLALSGGGTRAMVFHLGVLQLLSERKLFERVTRISTVSGGSLLVGLMLQENRLKWPASETFSEVVLPNLRRKLCASSLQWAAVRQLFNPKNWKYLLARANLLAFALENEWGVKARLSDLPPKPEWSINGTTAENGKRFRFKSDSLGDYSIGYASPGDFPLSSALAVSAALPVGFGPLRLETRHFSWKRRPWGVPVSEDKTIELAYRYLHLYDGGVYDNLGLEPFFDSGQGKSKRSHEIIIASDAGSPLANRFEIPALSPYRLKRVADILSEQSRALRVRTFSHYVQETPGRGAYLCINTPVSDCDSVEFATCFPTTLRRLGIEEFDRLFEHGYNVARNTEGILNI
jgi:NTE family protein